MCCGPDACQTVHTTTGEPNWYDCGTAGVPGDPSTYSEALARAAAAAYAPGVPLVNTSCQGYPAIGLSTGPPFATFVYGGPLAGYVDFDSGAPGCPDSLSPKWT
jgi:hypothetical protein